MDWEGGCRSQEGDEGEPEGELLEHIVEHFVGWMDEG